MDITFFRDFSANALATFLGIILGIPVAFWLNRRQSALEEAAQKRARQTETRSRARKMLGLLRKELKDDLYHLQQWRSAENRVEVSHLLRAYLIDELWRAFSDGGELQWIDDYILLSSLANAYAYIKASRYLAEEAHQWVVKLTPDSVTLTSIAELDQFVDNASRLTSEAIDQITFCLDNAYS